MKKRNILFIIVTIILSSCATKIPFTTDARKKLETLGINIQELQFYNSAPITLKRQIDSSEIKVVSGVVKYENGKYIEEIIIKGKTPGICDEIKDEHRIKVSFEDGEGNNLTFGDLNPSSNKYFLLGSKEWKNFTTETVYNGQYYSAYTPYGVSYLMIKNQKVLKQSKDSRVAKGRKIK